MKNFLRLQRVLSNWCSCPFQNPRAIPSGISAAHDRQHRVAFLQRQWFFHCLCFCLWASLPTVGFIRHHTASHSFPSYSLPLKKGKRKKTTQNHPHPALKKQKRKAKTLYLQGKRANADTDPASTLRMNLDPSLGEKKEKGKKTWNKERKWMMILHGKM